MPGFRRAASGYLPDRRPREEFEPGVREPVANEHQPLPRPQALEEAAIRAGAIGSMIIVAGQDDAVASVVTPVCEEDGAAPSLENVAGRPALHGVPFHPRRVGSADDVGPDDPPRFDEAVIEIRRDYAFERELQDRPMGGGEQIPVISVSRPECLEDEAPENLVPHSPLDGLGDYLRARRACAPLLGLPQVGQSSRHRRFCQIRDQLGPKRIVPGGGTGTNEGQGITSKACT